MIPIDGYSDISIIDVRSESRTRSRVVNLGPFTPASVRAVRRIFVRGGLTSPVVDSGGAEGAERAPQARGSRRLRRGG